MQNFRNQKLLPYERFNHPNKLQNAKFPPYDAYYSQFCSCSLAETEYSE